MRRLLVGIDLGTTNTTCSVADSLPDGTAGQITPLHILQFLHPPGAQNCFGPHDVLPSVVGLGSDGTVYTGLRAKTAAPELLSQHFRIVRDIKRQLGNPSWQVLLANRTLRPRHISALLLATVKRSLDAAYPDAVIEKLVLTTPASFSSMMRQETLAAADIAGFDPRTIDLLDEPVAALLSSLIQTPSALRPTWSGKPVLVFDMGGGTLDASIISISDTSRTVEILATSRYHEFAGNDIDLELAALLLQRIRASHDYDGFLEIHPPVGTASPALQIGLGLLSVGEQVKLNLSQLLQNGPQVGGIQNKLNHFRSSPTFVVADLTLDFNVQPNPATVSLSALDLVEQLAPYMSPQGHQDRDIFVPVQQVLDRANIRLPVDIFLAGAASYFPLVRDALASYFGQTPHMLDPIYAVSHGAVLWAAMKQSETWHITETLRDSIFLKRRGHTFLEVLTHPAPIPSNIHVKVLDPEESPYFSQAAGRIRLEFFQGEAPQDPLLSLCHIEDLHLNRALGDDARLTHLAAKVDANKVFHFDLTFEDRAGALSASVSFASGGQRFFRPDNGSNPLKNLTLNGTSL